jgi:hypothetical protein
MFGGCLGVFWRHFCGVLRGFKGKIEEIQRGKNGLKTVV